MLYSEQAFAHDTKHLELSSVLLPQERIVKHEQKFTDKREKKFCVSCLFCEYSEHLYVDIWM
jgi:hypothetical protein